MSVEAALARAVPGVRVSTAPVDRAAYARDLWPRRLLELRARAVSPARPQAIVWPRTTAEVAAVVRFAAAEGLPLVPFGAGSGVCGGVSPDARSVVLDLKKMSRVRAIDASRPTLEVEAGALGVTLEEDLGRRGYTLGHFPSSILCSTVGGWIAARSAGQCSGKYGKIEDMVASLEVVLGDGEVVTLSRRTGGLDLVPLVVGSEGTMGVVTSAGLRLHAAPPSRGFAAYSFATIEAGWTAMRDMFQAGLRPAVSRLYDPFDSFLAKQGSVKGDDADAPSAGHAPGGTMATLTKLLRAPTLMNKLMEAVGDRALGGSTLVLVFEGEAAENDDDLARAASIARAHGAEPMGEGPARRWFAHRYAVSYRLAPVFVAGGFGDTIEVAAPWSKLAGLYEGVRRALGRHVFVMAHLSHAYADGCCIYFTFAAVTKDEASASGRYDATWRAALDAAVEAGGTISHHHGVGRSKAPRLGAELGAGVDVVRALMRAADPGGVMNPGNLVGDGPRPSPVAPPTPPARAIEVDAASSLATVPASTSLAEAERELAARGFSLGLAPDAPRELGVGAWLAAGAKGAPDPWDDPADTLVAGLTATLPSGRTLSVRPAPRRATGPDLVALYVGGAGRFGAIADATLRVVGEGGARARPCPTSIDRSPPSNDGERALAARFEAAVRALP